MFIKEISKKIEAILFCNPEGINLNRLSHLIGIGSQGQVRQILKKMQEEYSEKGIKIIEENKKWKFKVADEFAELVKEAALPEIEKAVIETLAFIAWKKETTQNEIVKFRSNKAYNHIKELKNRGFINSKKTGKTNKITLTKKFYEYFNLDENREFDLEMLDSNK